MISYEEALYQIETLGHQKRLSSEQAFELSPLENAVGKVLAEDLFAQEWIPSFDNSAMDGFAIDYRWIEKASESSPVKLPILGCIAAGETMKANKPFTPSQITHGAIEIMTGAPLPDSATDIHYNAVIKIEEVEFDSTRNHILIKRPLKLHENIRFKGEDFNKGQLVLKKNTRIAPHHIMGLASLGFHQVKTIRKPKVAIISTGKEVLPYTTQNLDKGFIRNSTGPYLNSFLSSTHFETKYYGIVQDDPKSFHALMTQILNDKPDVIITTGAVSMGKYDFIKSVILDMGAKIHFHKVAIRPGKPLLFAEFNQSQTNSKGPVLFGVPGNPISTAIGLRFFITPYLFNLLGLPKEKPFKALLKETAKKPEGLKCFFKARVNFSEVPPQVESLKGQASFMVSPLMHANGWVVFDEPAALVEANTAVKIYPLNPFNDLSYHNIQE